MTYHEFHKEWLTLYLLMEEGEKVSRETLRRTLAALIAQEVEECNNPWETTNMAELEDSQWGGLLQVQIPTDPEESEAQQALLNDLLNTEEMHTALRWLRDEEATAENAMEEPPTLMALLWGVKLTEWDSGAGVGIND